MTPMGVPSRSTAEARRSTVIARAVTVFGRAGYHATPVTEVAEAAGISQAYVFRLFDGKLGLFVAALEHCFARIVEALAEGADRVPGGSPEEILAAMGEAYADLIADRDLLMLQVHAQSAAAVPEIREALRRGYASVVDFAQQRSRAGDPQVQEFMAFGQLCHLIVTADLDSVEAPWARALTAGMRHVGGH
jgi:AcrR family transcriptional regulator